MIETRKTNAKIGEILVQCGLVTPQQLADSLALAAERDIRVGEAMVELGFIDIDRLTWALGVQFDLSYVDLQREMIDWELLESLPLEKLNRYRILPLSRADDTVTVVISDPMIDELPALVSELFPLDRVVVQLSSEESILRMLAEAARRAGGVPSSPLLQAPRDILSILDGGQAQSLAVHASADEMLVMWRPAGSTEMKELERAYFAERLDAEFVRQQSLPGGFIGFRPDQGRGAQRVVTLTGPGAWLAIVETIERDLPRGVFATPAMIAGTNPLEIKSALLSALVRLDAAAQSETQLPPVILESYIHLYAPALLQFEIVRDRTRAATAERIAASSFPGAVVLEIDAPQDAASLAPLHGASSPLILLVRSPQSRKPNWPEEACLYLDKSDPSLLQPFLSTILLREGART